MKEIGDLSTARRDDLDVVLTAALGAVKVSFGLDGETIKSIAEYCAHYWEED